MQQRSPGLITPLLASAESDDAGDPLGNMRMDDRTPSSPPLDSASRTPQVPPVSLPTQFHSINAVNKNEEFSFLLAVARDLRRSVDIKDRSTKFRTHQNCFLGTEAVTWLASSSFCSTHTREEAVFLGRKLLSAGFFHHVSDDADFGDKPIFYRFFVDEDKLYKKFWRANSRTSLDVDGASFASPRTFSHDSLDSTKAFGHSFAFNKKRDHSGSLGSEETKVDASPEERNMCAVELQALADVWTIVLGGLQRQQAIEPSQWRLQPHVVCNSGLITIEMADSIQGIAQAMATCLEAQAGVMRQVTAILEAVTPSITYGSSPAPDSSASDSQASSKGSMSTRAAYSPPTDPHTSSPATAKSSVGTSPSGVSYRPPSDSTDSAERQNEMSSFQASPTLSFIPMMKRVLLGSRPSHAARLHSQPSIPETVAVTIPVPAAPPPPPRSLVDQTAPTTPTLAAAPPSATGKHMDVVIAYHKVKKLLADLALLRTQHSKLARQLLRTLRAVRRKSREIAATARLTWLPSLPRTTPEMQVFKASELNELYPKYKTVLVVPAAPNIVLRYITDCSARMLWDPGFASGAIVCAVDSGTPIDIRALRNQRYFARAPETAVANDDVSVSTASKSTRPVAAFNTESVASATTRASNSGLIRSSTSTLLYPRPLAKGERLPATLGTPGAALVFDDYFSEELQQHFVHGSSSPSLRPLSTATPPLTLHLNGSVTPSPRRTPHKEVTLRAVSSTTTSHQSESTSRLKSSVGRVPSTTSTQSFTSEAAPDSARMHTPTVTSGGRGRGGSVSDVSNSNNNNTQKQATATTHTVPTYHHATMAPLQHANSNATAPASVRTHTTIRDNANGGVMPDAESLPSNMSFPRVLYRQLDMRRVSSLMSPRDCVVLQDVGIWRDGSIVVYEVSVQHRDVAVAEDAVRSEIFMETYLLEPMRVPESMFGSLLATTIPGPPTDIGSDGGGAGWKSPENSGSNNATAAGFKAAKEGIHTFTKITRVSQMNLRGQVPPWLNGAVVDMMTVVPMRMLRDILRREVPCPLAFHDLAARLLQTLTPGNNVPRKGTMALRMSSTDLGFKPTILQPQSLSAAASSAKLVGPAPLLSERSSASFGRVIDIVRAGLIVRQRASISIVPTPVATQLQELAKKQGITTEQSLLNLSRIFEDTDSDEEDDNASAAMAPQLVAVLTAASEGKDEALVPSEQAEKLNTAATTTDTTTITAVDNKNDAFEDIPVDTSLAELERQTGPETSSASLCAPGKAPAKVGLADFELLAVLGRGGYGKVMLVRRIARSTEPNNSANSSPSDSSKGSTPCDIGKVYAMKILKKRELVKRQQVSRTITERIILSNLRHPFIVALHYAFQTRTKLYMVMDYVPGGDFFSVLHRNGVLGEERSILYIAEVVLALEHLHSRGIVYRDLKPENLLLDADGHIKMTDFGLSRFSLQKESRQAALELTFSFCGTEKYMAPEMLLEQAHNEVADWWTVGILTHELITGRHPFKGGDHLQTLRNIVNPTFLPANLDRMSSVAADFVKGLLQKNPNKRLGSPATGGIDAIKRHPFFRNRKHLSAPILPLNWDMVLAKEYEPMIKPLAREHSADVINFDKDFTTETPVDSLASGGTKHSDGTHTKLGIVRAPTTTTFSAFSYSRSSNSSLPLVGTPTATAAAAAAHNSHDPRQPVSVMQHIPLLTAANTATNTGTYAAARNTKPAYMMNDSDDDKSTSTGRLTIPSVGLGVSARPLFVLHPRYQQQQQQQQQQHIPRAVRDGSNSSEESLVDSTGGSTTRTPALMLQQHTPPTTATTTAAASMKRRTPGTPMITATTPLPLGPARTPIVLTAAATPTTASPFGMIMAAAASMTPTTTPPISTTATTTTNVPPRGASPHTTSPFLASQQQQQSTSSTHAKPVTSLSVLSGTPSSTSPRLTSSATTSPFMLPANNTNTSSAPSPRPLPHTHQISTSHPHQITTSTTSNTSISSSVGAAPRPVATPLPWAVPANAHKGGGSVVLPLGAARGPAGSTLTTANIPPAPAAAGVLPAAWLTGYKPK